MFNIDVQTRDSATIIKPEGRLDTVNSALFNKKTEPVLEDSKNLVIDLSSCDYLSSSGIRSLMTVMKIITGKGGNLMIAGISDEIFQVLEMTGLHNVFKIFDTTEKAYAMILEIMKESAPAAEIQSGNHHFRCHQLKKHHQPALIWNNRDIAGYNELLFAVGIGSPAESLTEKKKNLGFFITAGNASGFIPFDDQLMPDFRFVNNPANGGIFVRWAVSFRQEPETRLQLTEPSCIKPDQLFNALNQLPGKSGNNNPLMLLIADNNPVVPSLSLVLFTNNAIFDMTEDETIKHFPDAQLPDSPFSRLWGAKFLLSKLPRQADDQVLNLIKKTLVIENIDEITPFDLSTELIHPMVWIFQSDGLLNAEDMRIRVETAVNFPFEPYKAFLTRRLYTDSARVVIKQLHGGYSAQTFQVESFDHAGRKLRPTVLKIANRAIITREAERCQKYSLPFILNNSAIVLGTEFFGDTGALRYNFVGIGGEQTQLKWLTHYFSTWPADDLEPLFDKIFLRILKPWYGQPVKEDIHPFSDHDPTHTFFTTLCETAGEVLSIPADEPVMTIEETGEKRMNPYWYLKYEYPKRRGEPLPYLTSICHGDLNMQNILLDKEMNVYLIDFSETKPRSIVSDFARLEAIFMIEHAPLDNADDLKKMIAFTSLFYDNDSLSRLPDNTWNGKQPEKMRRNIKLTHKMRQYAVACTEGNDTIVPYYMAMLEWILPIVCYTGVPVFHKKLSAYVAGLLCEKVAELLR